MSAPIGDDTGSIRSLPGYEIERELGQGGMATVFLATQTSLNRKVALKALKSLNDPDHRARLINESRIIASLNHRNIITIYDVEEHQGCVFLSMEYLDGGDLAERVADGPLDPCSALEITANLGSCLAYAHDQGIVHRDIKPANILFHSDGTPTLTDFGIATDLAIDSELTSAGATVGTPSYVSPEQVQGTRADSRSDIYSLGIVLYEMLVGRPPFNEASAIETMAAHVSLPLPALPERIASLQPLIDRMIAKNPADRFASAAEMSEAARSLQLECTPDMAANADSRFSALADAMERLGPWLHAAMKNRAMRLAVSCGAAVACVMVAVFAFQEPDPIDMHLDSAERAFEEDRLAYPFENSSYYHYKEALKLDPLNDDAWKGIREIAEVYAERAEEDLANSNFPSAKFHIARGLEVDPANERLRQLRKDTNHLRHLPEKIVGGLKGIFNPS